ncbi:hypothetical protein EJD97_021134, partial [Solanum chilense]
EDNCPNIEETFWREGNDDISPSQSVLDDVIWSREDITVDIIDMPVLAQHSEDLTMETSEEEDDFDDVERMQKMEKQRRTMRQEVIADVVAQLKHAGLIDPKVLAALSVPLPRVTTSTQIAEQG